jgi:hypothetical protein
LPSNFVVFALNVVDVFECRALASASAVTSADHNGFLFSTLKGLNDDLQFVIGLTGMSCCVACNTCAQDQNFDHGVIPRWFQMI